MIKFAKREELSILTGLPNIIASGRGAWRRPAIDSQDFSRPPVQDPSGPAPGLRRTSEVIAHLGSSGRVHGWYPWRETSSSAGRGVGAACGQAIGFERLSALFRDIFGLPISEGALANLSRAGICSCFTMTGGSATSARRHVFANLSKPTASPASRSTSSGIRWAGSSPCHLLRVRRGMRPLTSLPVPASSGETGLPTILRSRPANRLASVRRSGQGRPAGPSPSDLPLTAPRTMAGLIARGGKLHTPPPIIPTIDPMGLQILFAYPQILRKTHLYRDLKK